MRLIGGIFSCIVGLIIWGVAISAFLSWLAICFGSIILGVILLIFAPNILLLPLAIGIPGTAFLVAGIEKISNKKGNPYFD